MFVSGGSRNGRKLNSVHKLNFNTKTWQAKANMTEARMYHSMSSDGIHIYVCAGHNGVVYLRTCERWDSTLNVWTAIAQMSEPGRHHLQLVSTGAGRLLAIGGWDSYRIDIIDVYNNATNEWTRSNVTLP